MFPFEYSLSVFIGGAWLAGLVLAAFIISWAGTDVGRMRRDLYIAPLTLLAGGFLIGFVAWTGAGEVFFTRWWTWGLAGAAAASAAMVFLARRMPRRGQPPHFAELFAWEGVVYGTAEGLLLSALPVAVGWQLARSLGWDHAALAWGGAAMAVGASILVVVVHHLGYSEFRGPLMRYPVIFCTVLAVSYLFTGSLIAPVVGHIALHGAMLRRGVELPPRARPATGERPRRLPDVPRAA